MNILYLCDEYPPGRHGGIGTAVRLLAREMVKQGHSVCVAGFYGLGYGGEDKFEDDGVTVYRFRRGLDTQWFEDEQSLSVRIAHRVLKDTGIIEWDIKRSLIAYKSRLENIIIDHQIDLVEMPDYNDYARFCRSFVPFPALSAPTIVKLHGSITYFNSEANKPVPQQIIKMEQAILNQAAAVSSVSKYTAIKTAGYLSYLKPIDVLHNGINTSMPPFNDIKNTKRVVFSGSLVHKKGIYQLARAWNIVNKSMPGAQLFILGKGPQQPVISHLNKEAVKTVSFKGHVTPEELYHYLAGSFISIFPSYSEAFALAPLEAMACGTAVIGSNRTSGPELIDDQVDGLLIDPDNIEQMASSLLYLLNDADACARLAKAGNIKVKEQFDISKIAAQNIRFYNEVLKRI